MKLYTFFTLLVVLIAACKGDKPAGENPGQDKPAKDTAKIDLKSVEKPVPQSPEQFRDYMLDALQHNKSWMMDDIIHTREELVVSMTPAGPPDSAQWKEKYKAFFDEAAELVKTKAEESFAETVRYGRVKGIDWSSPSGFIKKKAKDRLFPGYDLTLLFKTDKAEHSIKIPADSVSRGFVLGLTKIEMSSR